MNVYRNPAVLDLQSCTKKLIKKTPNHQNSIYNWRVRLLILDYVKKNPRFTGFAILHKKEILIYSL